MRYLALVSLIWAFSFGLIGSTLRGVDPIFVATFRLALALLLLAPFFRLRNLKKPDVLRLTAIGAIQFGVMYVAYIQAFKYIPSHLVALFSILTPVYVVLIHDIRKLSFHFKYFGFAFLSAAGAAVIKFKGSAEDQFWIGFALMQIAGIAFAFGQVAYRDWKNQHPEIFDQEPFALLYFGGLLFALISSAIATDWTALPHSLDQWRALVYLGLVASGSGFFLWNKGAAKTNPGTLAAFNNAFMPLGLLCSLFIFGEVEALDHEQLIRLAIGTFLIGGAVFLSRTNQTAEPAK